MPNNIPKPEDILGKKSTIPTPDEILGSSKKKEPSVSQSEPGVGKYFSDITKTAKQKPSASSGQVDKKTKQEIFTGFPGKEQNKYRVVNNQWQKQEPGKDWVTIKNSGSIIGLNKQFKKAITPNEKFEGISSKLIDNEEEQVVPYLQKQYGHLGFNFEETGAGDRVKVVTADGRNSDIFYLDNWTDGEDATEAIRLKAFLKENTETLERDKYRQVEEEINLLKNKKPSETADLKTDAFSVKTTGISDDLSLGIEDQLKLTEAEKKASAYNKSRMNNLMVDLSKAKKTGTKADDEFVRARIAEAYNTNDLAVQNRYINDGLNDIARSAEYVKSKSNQYQQEVEQYQADLSKNGGVEDESLKARRESIEGLGEIINKQRENIQSSLDQSRFTQKQLDLMAAERFIHNESKGTTGGGVVNQFIKGATNIARFAGLEKSSQEDLVKLLGSDYTEEEYINSKDRGAFESALFSLSRSVGAAVGGLGAGSQASFFADSYYSMMDEMDSNPDFNNVPEGEKQLLGVVYGLTIGMLEKKGLSVVSSPNSKVGNKLANWLIAKSLRNIPKGATVEVIEKEIENNIKAYAAKGLIKLGVNAGIGEGGTEFLQEIAGIGIKEIYNSAKGSEMFDTPDDILAAGFEAAALGTLGGTIMQTPVQAVDILRNGLSKKNTVQADIIEKSISDPETRNMLLSNIKMNVANGDLTVQEADEQVAAINESASIFNKLPDNISDIGRAKSFDLLIERSKIEKEIQDKDVSLVEPQRQRINAINEELKTIAQNAVQKQTTSEVPVQPETTTSQEMAKGESKAEPKVITEESQKEVEDISNDPVTYSQSLGDAITVMKEEGKGLDLQVSPVSVEDAAAIVKEGGKIFMTKDRSAGGYVKSDGYMGGLFKNPKSPIKKIAKAIQQARVEAGGFFMDAYATELEPMYIKNGFRPIARLKFNEEYAPEGWDAENSPLKNKPDVVFFAYDPEGKYNVGEGEYVEDYDQAYEMAKSIGTDLKVEREATVLSEAFGSTKIPLSKQIKKAQKAIKNVLPDVQIIVHNTEDEYRKATGETDAKQQASRGEYNPNTNTIHINKEKANGRTVAHEVFHAIIIKKVGSDAATTQLTDRMIRAVDKAVKKTGNKELSSYLNDFISNYDKNVQSEEKMAELVGYLAENYETLPLPTKNIIKQWIDSLMKRFGLKPMTDNEIVDLMNTIAGKVAAGEEISNISSTWENEYISSRKQLTENESKKISEEIVGNTKKGKNFNTFKVFQIKNNVESVKFEGEINQENVKKELTSSYNTVASKIDLYNTAVTVSTDLSNVDKSNEKEHKLRLSENKDKINKKIVSAKKKVDKIRSTKYKSIDDKTKKLDSAISEYKTLQDLMKSKSLIEMSNKIKDIDNRVSKSSLHNELIYNIGDGFKRLTGSDLSSKSDSIYNTTKDVIKKNLRAVHDSVSPTIRSISKLWYDGANVIAQNWANEYGLSLEQVSAIIATQSPQMPWFDNLHLAHVIMDTMYNADNMVFTEEMYNDYVLKAKEYDAQKKYIPNVKKLIGKKLSDLNNYDAAIFIRLDYDANISRKAPIRIPSGTNVDVVQKGDSSFSGYDVIAKGVSVFRDGSNSNIDDNIGRANKVRNFYLNIADPSNSRAVTIDTHAMAIALMKPLASNDFEVDFGPASFSFYADAYRELADELGIKARELQSITWEAARAIFPAKKKAKEGYKDGISSIWDKYNSGDISLEQVHLEIFNQSENPNITEWSDHIKELKDENKRKDVSGRIVRKQKYESSNRLGDVSRVDSRESRDGGGIAIDDKGSKVRKQLPVEVSEKLTTDGKGNYVFQHWSSVRRGTIKPGVGQNVITSKNEGSALSAVGGLAQYYTMKGQSEPGTGNVLHTVLIPMNRVYDFNSDPEGFFDEAKKRFNKVRPGQDFGANYQLAFITQLANENGYDMVIAKWRGNEYRAQTTIELTPENKNTEFKEPTVDTYNVGDDVEVFGMSAKITAIDGSILTYKGAGVEGKINIERNRRSISKVKTVRKQIDTEAKELESKKQKKDDTLYKIVKKGRDLSLSDAGIRKYAIDNGYTDKQISNAIVEYNLTEEGIFVKKDGTIATKVADSLKSFKRRMLSARAFLPKSVFKLNEQKNANIAYHLNLVDRNVRDFNKLYNAYDGDKKKLVDDFDLYLRGDMSIDLSEDFKIIANSMRNQIDGLSRQLIASGLIEHDDIQKITNNIGKYVTRSYAVYDRSNWRNEVAKEKIQAAKNYLKKEYTPWAEFHAKEENTDFEELLNKRVDQEIDKILTKDESSAFAVGGKLGSKNLSVLKERLDIPDEIRALMGEYDDPGLNYAQTVLKLSALSENDRFLTEVKKAGMGKFFYEKNDPRRPKEFNTEIASEGSKAMHPLNGLYTTKEVAEAFSKQPRQVSEVIKYFMKVQSVIKWNKTIGSVATHFKNIFGNVGFILMNAHASGGAVSTAFKTAKNDLFNGSKKELRDKMDHYIKLGIVKQSAGLGEIRDMFKDANFDDAMAARIRQKDLTLFEKAKRGLLRTKKGFEDWYQAEDDFFKIIAYENEVARYSDAMFGSKYKDITDAQKKEVDDVVSEIVKNVYPTYDRIPEAVQKVRRFPFIGNFVSFQAESYRTMWNTFALAKEELASDNPKIRAIGATRMAGATTYVAIKSTIIGYLSKAAGTGFTGLMGYLLDDEDEDKKDKDIRKFIAPWSKKSDLMLLNVGDGKIKYIDFSSSDPHGGLKKAMNSFFLGEDPVDGMSDFMYGLVEPFIGEEMATEALLNIRNNKSKSGGQLYNPEETLLKKGEKISWYLYELFEFGTITTARRIMNSDDKLSESAGITGYKPYEVDVNEQFGYTVQDLKDRIDNAKRIYNATFYNEEATEEEKKADLKRAQSALDGIYKELIDTYNSAERLGVDPEKLKATMMDSGKISKRDVRTIQAGEIPELKEKRE